MTSSISDTLAELRSQLANACPARTGGAPARVAGQRMDNVGTLPADAEWARAGGRPQGRAGVRR